MRPRTFKRAANRSSGFPYFGEPYSKDEHAGLPANAREESMAGRLNRLIQIFNEIRRIFDTDGDTNHCGIDPG
jgi:hypothetical protein